MGRSKGYVIQFRMRFRGLKISIRALSRISLSLRVFTLPFTIAMNRKTDFLRLPGLSSRIGYG